MSFTYTVMILSQLQKPISFRCHENQSHSTRSWALVYGSLRLTGSAIMHFVQIFTSREKYPCWYNASNELYRMIKNRINRRLCSANERNRERSDPVRLCIRKLEGVGTDRASSIIVRGTRPRDREDRVLVNRPPDRRVERRRRRNPDCKGCPY